MSGSGRYAGAWARVGLGPRVFAAMVLVVLAGAGTLLALYLVLAPELFADHLRRAMGTVAEPTRRHAEQAFAEASLLSLGLGVVVALVAAVAMAAFVARRIARPVRSLAAAAAGLAAGQGVERVPDPRLGPEFSALVAAFTTTADRLAGTERVRRRMLADLTHELRTPLAAIGATVEAVADGVLPADQSTWTALGEQTARLGRLVDDLSAVSRAEEPPMAAASGRYRLDELAALAAAEARARYAAKGVALSVSGGAPGLEVRVDPARMAQVLGNLLDNALRHTPAGGDVELTVDRVTALGRRMVRLVVADDGEGFDPAEGARLFERFYRGDRSRSREDAGSGIGLTISRAIVAAHHGTIEATSAGPGRGARVEIRLPAAGGHAPVAAPP